MHKLQFQAIMYTPMQRDDAVALSRGFRHMLNACSDSGGTQVMKDIELLDQKTFSVPLTEVQLLNSRSKDVNHNGSLGRSQRDLLLSSGELPLPRWKHREIEAMGNVS